MDGKYVMDRHLAAAGLVLYRNISGYASRLLGSDVPYTAFDWQLSLGVLVLLPLLTTVYPFIKYNYLPPSCPYVPSEVHGILSLHVRFSCLSSIASLFC
jgi:hypothetical protein